MPWRSTRMAASEQTSSSMLEIIVCMAFMLKAAPLHIQSVVNCPGCADLRRRSECNTEATEAMSCKEVHTCRMSKPSSKGMLHSEASDMVTPGNCKWLRLIASAKFTKRATAML